MDDRRRSARSKSFLQGRILFNGGRSSIDCVIRDISESGARLKFSSALPTPDHFDLYIPNRDEHRPAYVQWRRDSDIGIAFDRADPSLKPAPSEDRGDVLERLLSLEKEVVALRRLIAEMKADHQSHRGKSA
jgi:hypothetical protein